MRAGALRLGASWFPVVVALMGIAAYAWIIRTGVLANPVRSDGFSYYVYLPSWVIYHDPSLEAYAQGCCNGEFPAWSAIRRWEGTNRWVNPHPMGVAVLALPLFLGAHELTRVIPVSYRHAAALAGVVYLVAGVYVLKRLLARHFSDGAVLATLVAITFGTNLFHYAVFDGLWSHVYSFFLFACLLYLVDVWTERATWSRSLLIGFVVGLIFLVRHFNVLFALVVPLFGVVDRSTFIERLRYLRANAGRLMVAVGVAGVVALPQLAMYRYATGAWFADPYGYLMRTSGVQAWHFTDPHLAGILVTLPKGLLVWSPILWLSVVGWFLLRGRIRGFLAPGLLVLSVTTYVTASWFDWQLGASFGNRGFTDALALLAIPMGASYDRLFGSRRGAVFAVAISGLAITLSLFQMYQYWMGILPYEGITWAQYKAAFLRFR